MTLPTTFQALADPTRRKILELLKKKDLAVQDIAKFFPITLPSLSHHLAVLKNAKLVITERKGQQIIYSLNLSVFEEVAEELYSYFKINKPDPAANSGASGRVFYERSRLRRKDFTKPSVLALKSASSSGKHNKK